MTDEESDLPIIYKSSTYHVEEELIYEYDHEKGFLKLDISKRHFNELLANLGEFPEEGVSFCFILPQIGEVCFTGVQEIERIKRERGFIQRISRIFRRERK